MNLRVRLAWYATFGWIVLWLILGFGQWDTASKMGFNEWGDFFAGVSAPLAFLWLVIGYFQQGDELGQNTKALQQQERALQLQVGELKQSVEQQKEMVKYTQLSVKAAEEAARIEYAQKKKIAHPDFKNDGGSDGFINSSAGEKFNHQIIKITNIGGDIRSITFKMVDQSDAFSFLSTQEVRSFWQDFDKFEMRASDWRSGQYKIIELVFDKKSDSNTQELAFSVDVACIDCLDEVTKSTLYFYLQPKSSVLNFYSKKLEWGNLEVSK